jgi:hypothetical protein
MRLEILSASRFLLTKARKCWESGIRRGFVISIFIWHANCTLPACLPSPAARFSNAGDKPQGVCLPLSRKPLRFPIRADEAFRKGR